MARALANDVAEAASRGWLTSRTGPTSFCNIWMLTPSGLTVLNIEKGIA
ncbi:hypothetical protein [Phenylobacterium sp.]|nr:hypothetical protein [Phenylobacterium sp.]MDP3869912.1 hypothetical protein [Phenylobacterium sp.]